MVLEFAKFAVSDVCCRTKDCLQDSLSPKNSNNKRIKICSPASAIMIEKMECSDAWIDQDLFLTPPSSPCNLEEMCTRDLETSDEMSVPFSGITDSIVIKDCMWGAVESPHSKIREHAYTRLSYGELPCAGVSLLDNSDISNKFLNTVDPAEVFPAQMASLDERMFLRDLSSPESDDESDTDVDVVTVDPKLAENDSLSRTLDILTPPNTPDSEPMECTKAFPQTFTIEKTVTTKTRSSSSDSIISENVSRRMKIATLPAGFSRASHNVLERKRRNELKGKFYSLRDSVPDLMGNKKVPKVVILKKAISYIESMKDEEHKLKTELQRQKKTQQELRRRLTAILRQKSMR